MGLSDDADRYKAHRSDLTALLDSLLSGTHVFDQAAVERQLVPAIGALVYVHRLHKVDDRGRCALCWRVRRTWWYPWPRRTTCTVHAALNFYLRQPAVFVMQAAHAETGNTVADHLRPWEAP